MLRRQPRLRGSICGRTRRRSRWLDELEGWVELGGELPVEELVASLERAPVRTGPPREGARRGRRPAPRPDAARRGRLPPRAGGGRPAAADPAVAVPRRGAASRARRSRTDHESRPGLACPVSVLHGLHEAVAAPLPRSGGRDRRRRTASGEPVLGGRLRAASTRRRLPLDAAAAALPAGLADRGGSERTRATARALLAGDDRPLRRPMRSPARTAGTAGSTARSGRSTGRLA